MRPHHLTLLALVTAIAAAAALRFATASAPDGRPSLAASSTTTTATASTAATATTTADQATRHPPSLEPAPEDALGSAVAGGAQSGGGASDDGGAPSTSTGGVGLVRVSASEPRGTRVALDAKVVVRFDRAPAKESVALTMEPVAEGKTAWVDAKTLTFTPARWAEGKPYRARVSGAGVETATFEFRSMVPPPERVEPGHGARMVLTFDDGADKAAQVSALLDLLEKEHVQAIFFPTGRWAEESPRLLLRMTQEGHRVCNHTYSHQNLRLPQLTEGEIRTEIARGAGVGTCELFRPPLKAFDPRVERIVAEMGYKLYLWDIDSRDWEGAESEDIVNLVLSKAHPDAVVLFHMHAQATLDALPLLLPRLRKAGYVFGEVADAGAEAGAGAAPAATAAPSP